MSIKKYLRKRVGLHEEIGTQGMILVVPSWIPI